MPQSKEDLEDSTCIGHEPCPECGSKDNLARYSDGHAYCFTMGCDYYEFATDVEGEHAPSQNTTTKGKRMSAIDMLQGEFKALTARGIKEETCRHFGYQVGMDGDKHVHIANYKSPVGTNVVAQKVRDREKNFYVTGDLSAAGLYGEWLWRDQGKMVVITEGEIDALTVSQLQDNKWPVVSVPTGAKGAKKALSASLQWLLGFETIVLYFDDDEAGALAVEECAPLFPPGRVKVAKVSGYKDANAAFLAGKSKEVINAIWSAKEHRPDGIVSVADVREEALTPPVVGRPWPWDTLTKATLGRRLGEVYVMGAGTGVGKSEVFDQIIATIVKAEDRPVAVFKFEQPVGETVKRVAGKMAGRRFHILGGGWEQKELVAVVDQLIAQDKLHMYDHFGHCDWDAVKSHIRYLVAAKGVEDVFIDHLTALADTGDSERGSLEGIMKEVATLAQELKICIYLISHLTTPDTGPSHEEGGRVTIRQFKGSRAIGFWSHFMFGLERDQQNEDPALRGITTFRCLKDRYTGQSVGTTFLLAYDKNTGMLTETEMPEKDEDDPPKRGKKRGEKQHDKDTAGFREEPPPF